MRILVAEDEKRLSDALCQILKEQKYSVDAVYDGIDALAYAEGGIYDVIVLDVMMPGKTGLEVLSEIRRKKNPVPVLILTALDSLTDKVRGLDAGADDYLTKPFSPEELLARIRVLTRRKGEIVSDVQSIGDLEFDVSSSALCCTKTGKSIRLNFKETALFRMLSDNAGRVIPKETLVNKVWGYDADLSGNNLEAYVSFLRRKLAFIGSGCAIVSRKKMGYRLDPSDD